MSADDNLTLDYKGKYFIQSSVCGFTVNEIRFNGDSFQPFVIRNRYNSHPMYFDSIEDAMEYCDIYERVFR